MVSDDTEHTWMVARALLASSGEPQAFGRSLARQMKGWLLCVPAGVGLATLRATLRLLIGVPCSRSGVFSAGNGPAMRSALLGVCWGHDLPRLRELVSVSTRITHTDPKAETGAMLVAIAAHIAATKLTANGQTRASEEADATLTSAEVSLYCGQLEAALTEDSEEWAHALQQIQSSVLAGQNTEDFAVSLGLYAGVSGYILHTVPVALHAWLRFPRQYERAVTEAIRCGGDTDTVAAIVGALVGAAVGPEGIRRDLRTRLWEWPRSADWFERLGRALASSHTADKKIASPAINILMLLARNLVFLIVVLAHGFRRLLPPY